MRAIWKGNISFALVSIPISLFSATRRNELSFHYLHKKDMSPVSYKRFCDTEDTEVPWEEITKGYEYEKGRYVEITDEDLDKADIELLLNLVRKNDGNPYVEGSVRHLYLESFLADGGHMLPIDVNECHIVAGPRESAADDSADGSRADDDHARAHVNLPGDLTKTGQRYWKLAGPSNEVCWT